MNKNYKYISQNMINMNMMNNPNMNMKNNQDMNMINNPNMNMMMDMNINMMMNQINQKENENEIFEDIFPYIKEEKKILYL